ncbi:hypothetical protein HY631_04240 [Candidatus Uhrbacteria bacterium]|nr:hypothetical protein [Candidatus Uhrbacteria bacterium]
MRGIIVTGTGFFAGNGTVWRARLMEVIVGAIHGFDGLPKGMPIFVSLPCEPFLQQPRGSAIIQIDIYQYDWPNGGAIVHTRLGDLVTNAVTEWIEGYQLKDSQTKDHPSGVLVTISNTSYKPFIRTLA